jgi:hypothetical protein
MRTLQMLNLLSSLSFKSLILRNLLYVRTLLPLILLKSDYLRKVLKNINLWASETDNKIDIGEVPLFLC